MTRIERQLLINQYKILSLLDGENSYEYDRKIQTLESGLLGFYDEVFSGREETAKEIEKETGDVLSMFRHLEHAVATLPADQQQQFSFSFKGFDGNNDPHYSVARFLIEQRGMYDEHAGKNLNSHTRTTLMQYRKMLALYDSLTDGGSDLGLSELQQIAAV